jgi:hypothetical protein
LSEEVKADMRMQLITIVLMVLQLVSAWLQYWRLL